jgi:DNA transposition AAA+ family ATPase/predicted XRE-type DNA-binding protein
MNRLVGRLTIIINNNTKHKIMKTETKQQISEQLKLRLTERAISQSKAANAIGNTSSTAINFIVNKKWEDDDKLISAEQWNRVAAWLGINQGWNIDTTYRNYKRISNHADNCQKNSIAAAIIGEPGLGKSQTLKSFSATRSNVFYIECAEYWTKKVFLNKLKQSMGMDVEPASISDMVDDITSRLLSFTEPKPLVIIDEADKLSDNILSFFNSIYNITIYKCGFVLAGAPYLKQRLDKGVRLNKKNYKEAWDRVGKGYITLSEIQAKELRNICLINGIESEEHINRVTNSAENSLRRVKSTIATIKREIEKQVN